MKMERLLRMPVAWSILACAPLGLAYAPHPQQEPVRARDGAEFRSRAAAEGLLLELGGRGRRFPGATALRWSPDSRQILALSDVGDHALLDAKSGRVLKTLYDPEEVYHESSATWTVRGTLLLQGYSENYVFREEPGGDWGVGPSMEKLAGLTLLGASQDGAWALMQGGEERHLLDLSTMSFRTSKSLKPDDQGWLPSWAIAPDGSHVAWPAMDDEGSFVELTALPEAATSEPSSTRLVVPPRLPEGESAGEEVSLEEVGLAFSRGHDLLACLFGGDVLFLDTSKGTVAGIGRVSEGRVTAVQGAGDYLVTLDDGGGLRCWSTPHLVLLGELTGFQGARAAAVSPDDNSIAVLGRGGEVDFVRVSPEGQLTLETVRRRDSLKGAVTAAFFGSVPGELLLGTSDGKVLRADLATLQAVDVPCRTLELIQEVTGFVEWPLGVRMAIQTDGARYVDKRKRGGAARADLAELQLGWSHPAASADGSSLLMETWDDTVEVRTGLESPRVFPGLESASSMALSPSGKTAALVSESELWLFDARDMMLLYRGGADGLPGVGREDAGVDSVGGFLDETHMAIQYEDGSVRLVDISGDVVSELHETERFSFLMDWISPIVSMDGRWLLCTGSDQGLRVFDLDSETLELVLAGDAWTEGVKDWALSADSAHLAVVNDRGGVELWDFPGLMGLAGRMANEEGLGAGPSDGPIDGRRAEFAQGLAEPSLLAAEQLRRDGRDDEALAGYLLAEVAAPLEEDAMGAHYAQRQILAGVVRCGGPAAAWLAVRKARGHHRESASRWGTPTDPDFSTDSQALARLMDPRREPAGRLWGRPAPSRPSVMLRGGMEALRTPNFQRVMALHASGAAHVKLWRAAVDQGGEGAGMRARFRALDQLSLEPASRERAALLAQLSNGRPSEEELGQAWWELATALADSGFAQAARAARDQGRVWRREFPPEPGDGRAAAAPGASRLRGDIVFGTRDARRALEILKWANSGEWLGEERRGEILESVLNYVFAPAERLEIADGLKSGDRSLILRVRLTGERQVGVAFGAGGIEVGCRMNGPVMQVRAVHKDSGVEVLAGRCLLTGPAWAPVDITVSVNAARSQITVQAGEAEPWRGEIAPEDVEGPVALVLSGLGSQGELAVRGYRLK